MKLRFSYTRQGVPVEVEVQGPNLSPETASRLLATSLREVDGWLEKILPKKEAHRESIDQT